MMEWFTLECLYPSSLILLYAFQQSVMIYESGSLHYWEYLKLFIPICCGVVVIVTVSGGKKW
jgi:hypothetical protein